MTLTRSELREGLTSFGFQRKPQLDRHGRGTKDDKAHRYEYPGLRHPLYLLVGVESTQGNFLVLHPQLESKLLADRALHKAEVGVSIKSTGLKAFPRKKEDPKGDSNWGVPLGFISAEDMSTFLAWLTESTEGASLAVQHLTCASDYVCALQSIESSITGPQRRMLIGHAMAPEQTLTMHQIAELGGYTEYRGANLQYGKLGGLLATALSLSKPEFQVYAIADFQKSVHDPITSQTRARMHTALHKALVTLGWIPGSSAWAAARAEVEADPAEEGVAETVKLALTAARIGQGQFRAALLKAWEGCCAITGCNLPSVLVASHVKPWAQSTNTERLDPFNGLLLSASVDRLFDRGLVSFGDDGKLLRKPSVTDVQLTLLGLSSCIKLQQVTPNHRPYLAAHRALHGF